MCGLTAESQERRLRGKKRDSLNSVEENQGGLRRSCLLGLKRGRRETLSTRLKRSL